MKKTDWYPPEIKPVRKGYYELKNYAFPGHDFFGWWTGRRWKWSPKANLPLFNQQREWRGLTEPQS